LIISKTPYRISFFGGGSDYPEWYKKFNGEVISSTIDKYIYISCRDLPPFFKHKFRIVYSKIELTNNIKDIKHLVVKHALKKINKKSGLEIHYDGDLPARSGMGSSSSFVVGLLNILNKIEKKNANKEELAKLSINLEKNILREKVGCQDQIAASYGGFNSIKFDKNGKFKVKKICKDKIFLKKLNNNLFLCFTGISRTAEKIANTYIGSLNNKKKQEIKTIMHHVDLAKKIIKNKNLDDFGYLLDETWSIKKKLSSYISNPKIDYMYKLAKKNGALGGKLLGAGGGGFMIFYVPVNKREKFEFSFKKFLNIPFKFSNQGSQIIFNK